MRLTNRENSRSAWRIAKRWLVKSAIFVGFTLVVLNPNLKRTFLQVAHILDPEKLIQTQFAALSLINHQVDQFVSEDAGQHSEARLVARFVLKTIRYVSDYRNWGNLDYWPTAEEAWQKRQEDCDGRAILAASILRSRGFHSAGLVIGLDHMWIKVNENEKDPSKPPHIVALLSPNPDFALPLEQESRWHDLLCLARALLHPKAFCETSTHLFADIPGLRKFVLVTAFLLLCLHPYRKLGGMVPVLALGLVAAALLASWQPATGHRLLAICGGSLLLVATAGAVLMQRPWGRSVRLMTKSHQEREPTA